MRVDMPCEVTPHHSSSYIPPHVLTSNYSQYRIHETFLLRLDSKLSRWEMRLPLLLLLCNSLRILLAQSSSDGSCLLRSEIKW